ncbi:MAG: hypothetical protein MJ016_02395 [Victivallaceae bacterium]|nr:hypothetical protein [Victivallaceae bacterium]
MSVICEFPSPLFGRLRSAWRHRRGARDRKELFRWFVEDLSWRYIIIDEATLENEGDDAVFVFRCHRGNREETYRFRKASSRRIEVRFFEGLIEKRRPKENLWGSIMPAII